ncbi:MAG: sigma-70 family RNA polymerase sigma factor [Bythopirellula sp.]|nr:sigma-70 family RNA polymerase sigma factor [Bythopirellula sp.]
MTDAELLRAACDHDAEAWKVLYTRYLPLAWRYAYAQVGDVHIAEDVVSETMLALLKNIHQIDINPIEGESAHIAGWLRSVVRHKVADHHRQAFRLKDRLEKIGRENTCECASSSPTLALETAETRAGVLAILEQLPAKQRLVLEWKYAEGLRVREIAERLNETEKGIEATLYRARREFRRCYELSERSSSVNGAALNGVADVAHSVPPLP